MPSHSRTYIHDEWGCDIDVHHSFPGFFAPAEEVFDALWIDRQQLRIAHTELTVPSLAGASIIAALHGLRNQNEARQQREYERIRELVSASFSDADRQAFVEIARRGGATWSLKELLEHVGIAVVDAPPSFELQQQWILNRTYGDLGSTLGWWIQLRSQPLHRRPALIARAVWVPRVDIPRNDLDTFPSRGEAWRYQTARWVRGARALTRYLLQSRNGR